MPEKTVNGVTWEGLQWLSWLDARVRRAIAVAEHDAEPTGPKEPR